MITVPTLKPGKLILIPASRTHLRSFLPAWVAALALEGHVRLLDCGNCFDAHAVARELYRENCHSDRSSDSAIRVYQALERVSISRAFTCYQVITLLSQTQAAAGNPATFVLDLLNTFTDEDLKAYERERLLRQSLNLLKKLSRAVPLAVNISPRSVLDPSWQQKLAETADLIWVPEQAEAQAIEDQPSLSLFNASGE